MLARVKVLTLQLLLDIVKAYNDLAELLPALPPQAEAAAAAADRGTQAAKPAAGWLMPASLAAALRPRAQGSTTRPLGTAGGQPPPPAQTQPAMAVTASAAAASQPPQPPPQQQQQQQLRASSQAEAAAAAANQPRSLRMLMGLRPQATAPPQQQLQQPPQPLAAPSQQQQQQQPEGIPASADGTPTPAAGPSGLGSRSSSAPTTGASTKPTPLPHMVRCRWDERRQVPYIEAVPPGPDDPTWQQRSERLAEQYGYMIAVQLDDLDAAATAGEGGGAGGGAATAAGGPATAAAAAPAAPAVGRKRDASGAPPGARRRGR
ncbi:hypothetical protein GPECTOR_16g548 [Gonium pectorale]|uniref:Uncharacterized protein n=1 Tax=Gonium pectorale TaxID=33097 RepID=A0A150GKW5_GONPE|nr:hypothetical protein GPECTOR_16g548 [Gonium pectorale]|eukprot:KXZ50375.1 hypothetical protein GPECTOR_16g548 [Gonium pectorale]